MMTARVLDQPDTQEQGSNGVLLITDIWQWSNLMLPEPPSRHSGHKEDEPGQRVPPLQSPDWGTMEAGIVGILNPGQVGGQ